MAELVMDNPFSKSVSATSKFAKPVQDLKDCIAKLKEEFVDTRIPLNDDNQDLHRFCAKLEYLLQAGLKVKTGLLGGKKDYWNYFCDCLGSNKSLNDGIQFVKSLNEVRNNLGRGRALIRFGLTQQRLADTLQQCVINTKVTGDWYQAQSVWLSPSISSDIVNALYDLNDIQFDLTTRGYDLDTSWPSFAKRPYGQNLQIPGRSTSVSSLSSIQSSLPTQSVDPDTQSQVDLLEHEKLAAEHKSYELENQLTQLQAQKTEVESVNQILKSKVTEVQLNAKDVQLKSDGNDLLCEKLANELHLKESLWAEQEQHFQDRLEDSKKTIKRLEDGLEKAVKEAQQKSNGPSAMDMLELKGKLRLSETNAKTLRIELDSAQKEVLARNKVNDAKDALINMQDKKLDQQKKQLAVLEKTQQVGQARNEIRSKETDAEIQKLEAELKERKRLCDILTEKNVELEAIFQTVQTKSTDIGKLAKEKLTKYKAENEELKAKVENLEASVKGRELATTELEKLKEESRLQIADMAKENGDFEKVISELRSNLLEKEAVVDEHQKTVEGNREEIKHLKQLVENFKSESGSKETELTESLLRSQEDHRAILEKSNNLSKELAKSEAEAELKQQELSNELERLKCELRRKTKEVETVTSDLEGELSLVGESVRQKEGENAVLLQQLESQGEEMEILKQELTGLGKVLSQASGEEDEVDDLNKLVHSVVDKHKFLHQSVESMKSKNDELQATVKTTECKLEESMSDLDRLRSEKDELQASLSGNEESLHDYQLQLQQKTVFVQEVQESHTRLEEQIKLLEARMEQSDLTVKEMAEESEVKDKLITAKQVQFESLRDKVSLLEELVEQVEEEKKQVEDEEQQCREELRNAERKITELETVIEVGKNTQASLRQEVSEIRSVSEQQQVELEHKVEYVKEKEVELLQTSKNKSNVDTQLQEARCENSLLQEKIDSLARELVTVKSDAKESGETYKQRISELEQGNYELTKQNTSLCESGQRREKASKEYMEDIQGLKEVKGKLSGKINKLEEDCDKWMQKVQDYQKENDTLSNSVKSMESDMAKLQHNKETMQTELEVVKKQLHETSQLNEELLTSTEQGSKVLSEKEEKQTEMQGEIEAKTSEVQILKNQLSDRQLEIDSLNTKVTDIENEKDDLSESMNASYFELREKLGQYECENEALREEMQSIIGDKEKQFLTLAQEISKLKSESYLSAEELVKKEQERCELNNKVTMLSQELEVFQTTVQEKDAFISELQAKTRLKEEEMDQLRSGLDSGQAEMDNRLQEINSQLSTLKETLQEKESEMVNLQDTHQQELQAVRFQLSTELMQLQTSVQEQKDKEKEVTNMTERVSELEFLIEDLQTQLQDKTDELVTVTEKHQQQIDDLEERLFEKEREGQLMAEQLVRSNKVIEEDIQRVQSERNESFEKLETVQVKNTDLEAENLELKKKLIQLIREKDSLWKKSDKLEYQKKMKASLVWENSDRATNCTACNTQFGFTLRKHHCRLCGQIFCHYCCNNWVMTSFSSKKERVCGNCQQQQSQLESASEGEDSGSEGRTEEDGGQTLSEQLPSLRSPMWKVKPSEELGLEVDDTAVNARKSLALDLDTVDNSSALDNSGSPNTSLDQEKLLSMTDESKSDRLHQQSLDTEPRKYDEAYDLITSEEVAASLQEPVPDPDTEMAPMLNSESFEPDGTFEGPTELWIRPGKAFAAAVRIDEAGTTLKWEFTTYPKDINFGLMYRETEWTSFEESDCLIPMCKCNSHKKPIDGELSARKPGIYTLMFDNKSSRFTAKKLMYKLQEEVLTTDNLGTGLCHNRV